MAPKAIGSDDKIPVSNARLQRDFILARLVTNMSTHLLCSRLPSHPTHVCYTLLRCELSLVHDTRPTPPRIRKARRRPRTRRDRGHMGEIRKGLAEVRRGHTRGWIQTYGCLLARSGDQRVGG